jgi:hypothetical protein
MSQRWTEKELTLLNQLVGDRRPVQWAVIAEGVGRTVTACAKAYLIHFGPLTKRKQWTQQEDAVLLEKKALGWHWATIARHIDRTYGEVKTRWFKLIRRPSVKLSIIERQVDRPTDFLWISDHDDFEFSE